MEIFNTCTATTLLLNTPNVYPTNLCIFCDNGVDKISHYTTFSHLSHLLTPQFIHSEISSYTVKIKQKSRCIIRRVRPSACHVLVLCLIECPSSKTFSPGGRDTIYVLYFEPNRFQNSDGKTLNEGAKHGG